MYFIFNLSQPFVWASFFFLTVHGALAQQTLHGSVKGLLIEKDSPNPIPFINVTLYNRADSMLLGGTQSLQDGRFVLSGILNGRYMLRFTSVAHTEKRVEIELTHEQVLDLDTILLSYGQSGLQEVTIRGEREKAKSEVDKTVFQISKKMLDVASTGVDLLKLLPGFSIDLMQNISLEGSANVIFLVNGMERDGKYLNQLQAADIDKIEIMASPPARYEGGASRVINVMLKSDRQGGMALNVNFEAPTSRKQIYTFPSARLSYGRDKIDMFVSYNGSLGYFDILEESQREIDTPDGERKIMSYRKERQKNWSHRFLYGVDYALSKRNSISLYGYLNPYAQQLDGYAETLYEGPAKRRWNTRKEDDDKNLGSFYALFYKGNPGKRAGSELTVDGSLYGLRAKNQNVYTDIATGSTQINLIRPLQNSYNLRADYTIPFHKNLRIVTGFQVKRHRFADRNASSFTYLSTSKALHGSARFSKAKFTTDMAIRVERATLGLQTAKSRIFTTFLPNLAFQYQLTEGRSLKATYQKSLEYPGLYQLNPYVAMEDPYTYRSGNPSMGPVDIRNAGVEYSRNIGKSWIAFRTFYHSRTDVINELARVDENEKLYTQLFNSGRIQQYGGQLTGTFSIGQAIQMQSYLKLFRVFTRASSIALYHDLENQQKTAYEIALSGNASLPYGFVISAQFTYNSPLPEMQKIVFTDPLYFISFQKTFSKALRTGLTFAFPFGRTFTFQGERISSATFSGRSKKVIRLSALPVFLKVAYNFNKGGKRKDIGNAKENMDVKRSKGF